MNQLLILLCMCFGVQGLNVKNNVTLGSLPAKERNRRLIPYMTFYLGQPQNAQYRQVMAVPYIAVPQYRPVPQRFIQQQTPLTRMITQNYLNLAKQLQDNPRGQVRVNPNYQSEMKYYAQLLNHDLSGPQEARVQYAKPQHILQFTRPQTQEQYPKQAENDYEQTEENPQENNHYAKPSPGALVHYMKPEVQQYVTKVNSPSIHYTKGEQDDYDDTTQQRIPIRYPQYATSNEYTNNLDLQQTPYNSKPENSRSAYIQKPLLQYGPKITITPSKLAPQPADYPGYITGPSHNPNIHQGDDVTPSNLTPQPADIPEYITRPIHKTNLHHKGDKTSITIMQSQEIDVDVLPSTPATPKYHATYVAKPHSYVSYPIQTAQAKPEEELDPEIVDKNFNDILQGVSLSKTLPERITTENLDSSIKTLSKILRILQRANTLPQSAKHIVKGFPKPAETLAKAPKLKLQPHQQYNDGSTPGRAHIDYPAYDEIPQTNFNCKDQRYKGFFGDPETRCQVWHYCDLNGGQASFLCPNGTIFSQVALTCDWWFNVKCASTAQLYVLNERLYKYILPQKPSFPEDYSGPLVDHYLALKFKEIEEKNKNKTEEHKEEKEEEEEPPFSIDEATQNKVRSVE